MKQLKNFQVSMSFEMLQFKEISHALKSCLKIKLKPTWRKTNVQGQNKFSFNIAESLVN